MARKRKNANVDEPQMETTEQLEEQFVAETESDEIDEELLSVIENSPTKDVIEVKDTFNATLTKQEEPPVLRPLPLIRWRKLGGGSLVINKKMIKPNQVFTAREEDIPKQFMSTLQKLDDNIPKEEPVVNVSDTKNFSIKKIEDTEMYNIVNSKGKVINESPLSYDYAVELLKAYKG